MYSNAIFYIFLLMISCMASGEIIDLGHGFSEDTNYWVGVTKFSFTSQVAGHRPDGQWYAVNDFCAGEHGGTHLDAPYHFNKEGWTVDQIPQSRLFAPGILIDVSNQTSHNADYELTVQDIQTWQLENGEIPNSSVVLVDFGWAKYYDDRTAYFGSDQSDDSLFHFPGISPDAARYLAETHRVVGVGVDVPSVDRGQTTNYKTHATLQSENIYHLENVALNNKDVPVKNFFLLVMPIKIVNGTGAPCRIFALTNEHGESFLKLTN